MRYTPCTEIDVLKVLLNGSKLRTKATNKECATYEVRILKHEQRDQHFEEIWLVLMDEKEHAEDAIDAKTGENPV